MTRVVLRGLLGRKLRTTLTALAIVLGVAMLAGTYAETDRIDRAFKDIFLIGSRSTSAYVKPKTAYQSSISRPPSLPISVVEKIRGVRGVAAVAPEIYDYTGFLVRSGHVLRSGASPTIVISDIPPPFRQSRLLHGRYPARPGEVAVDQAFAADEDLGVGQRLGFTARSGVAPVRIVGVFEYAPGVAFAGSRLVLVTFADAQRWLGLEGRTMEVAVAAAPGVSDQELVRRLQVRLPQLEVQTGREYALESAKQVTDQINAFLGPTVLALAGAAVLVGAFIIFNTFSITVAQRTRELALVRTIGGSRTQVVVAILGEALLLGLASSLLGLLAGLGFASLLNRSFAAAGFGVPTAGLRLEPRTIAIALTVGVGATLASALVPALRAIRVSPVLGLREGAELPPSRLARFLPLAGGASGVLGGGLLGLALLLDLSSGDRLRLFGLGAVLLFVGLALLAPTAVRPLAAALGWPLQQVRGTVGVLARQNTTRNPSRTAATAAAVMVGIGLVAFVGVFAASLTTTIDRAIQRLVTADVIVRSEVTAGTFSPQATHTVRGVPGVAAAVDFRYDAIRINDQPRAGLIDYVSAADPTLLSRVYRINWQHGGTDLLLAQLHGNNVIIESQFAARHNLTVGSHYRATTPSGRSLDLRVLGIYHDPTLIQGTIVAPSTFARLSTQRDPMGIYIALKPGADPTHTLTAIKRALAAYPALTVESQAEFRHTVRASVNVIAYMLYALLGISLIVSLLGMLNSLLLTSHERTRELGMLHAIGATSAQLRRLVRYESAITALIGGLLGITAGLGLGWAGTRALSQLGIAFAAPLGQLALFLLVALLVGVLAALLPARRAARLPIVQALRYE